MSFFSSGLFNNFWKRDAGGGSQQREMLLAAPPAAASLAARPVVGSRSFSAPSEEAKIRLKASYDRELFVPTVRSSGGSSTSFSSGGASSSSSGPSGSSGKSNKNRYFLSAQYKLDQKNIEFTSKLKFIPIFSSSAGTGEGDTADHGNARSSSGGRKTSSSGNIPDPLTFSAVLGVNFGNKEFLMQQLEDDGPPEQTFVMQNSMPSRANNRFLAPLQIFLSVFSFAKVQIDLKNVPDELSRLSWSLQANTGSIKFQLSFSRAGLSFDLPLELRNVHLHDPNFLGLQQLNGPGFDRNFGKRYATGAAGATDGSSFLHATRYLETLALCSCVYALAPLVLKLPALYEVCRGRRNKE
ncbi:unnamed protein product [Amoebophrya sp. A120]|nr:unnamed protein product [Amoebophrya sp. A120]|eukprot:GSA120T00023930001.1